MNFTTIFIIGFSVFAIAALIYIQKTKLTDTSWKQIVRSKISGLDNSSIGLESKIIQADKLLEFTLKKHFNNDQNLGVLLKKYPNAFEKHELNDIWQAHKLRNGLAHDIHFAASNQDKQTAANTLIRFCKKFSR